jgi:uncharacterized RDD family membrane protein YckC
MDYQEYVAYEPILSRRATAAFLDYATYFFLLFGLFYTFGHMNSEGQMEIKGLWGLFSPFFIWFLYFPLMEAMFGYTLFKGLFDLKVVCERRMDFPLKVTLLRHLVDFIDFAFFGIVAFILVRVRDDHKRLGDMLAHSHVALDK